MNESLLFQNARKLAKKYTNEEVLIDLQIFNEALKIIGPSTLIEEPFKDPNNDNYQYKPSKVLIFIVFYLKEKYSNILICLARFNKIIEIFYEIDHNIFEQKAFADLASYIFLQHFKNSFNKINSGIDIFENKSILKKQKGYL